MSRKHTHPSRRRCNLLARKDGSSRKRDPLGMTPAQVLNTLVADVLATHPATAGVFVRHRTGCVGCTFARFETVGEVAAAYGLDPQELARSMSDVLRSAERT